MKSLLEETSKVNEIWKAMGLFNPTDAAYLWLNRNPVEEDNPSRDVLLYLPT